MELLNYTENNTVIVFKGVGNLTKSTIIKSVNEEIANTILDVKDSSISIKNLIVECYMSTR
ncbi:hypothetical protein CNQ82_03870 [Staphylococcus debuckii]|nr:hypothetical protein CNQ82_03870 [Staphylococcus debuckii]